MYKRQSLVKETIENSSSSSVKKEPFLFSFGDCKPTKAEKGAYFLEKASMEKYCC